MSQFFPPKLAGRTATYLRGLRQMRLLTPHEHAALDTMLWTLRKPGQREIEPSYADIAHKAGIGRNVAVNAVAKAVAFGILRKTQRWLLKGWGRKKGHGRENLFAHQTTNLYVFCDLSDEFTRPTASTQMDILIARVERQAAAARADTPLERALLTIAATAGLTLPS